MNDRTAMDVIYKRSTDDGATWSKTFVIAEGIPTGETVASPCMVVGKDNRVHCFYVVGVAKAKLGGWVAYTYSDDNGISWSEPQDISGVTKPEERGLLGTGPGHGILLESGTIVIPIWYLTNRDVSEEGDAFPAVTSTLYSTDNGKTWAMGDSIAGTDDMPDPNENTIVELSDGRVYMNIRSEAENHLRAFTISPDGYSGWSAPEFDVQLSSSICFGSLANYEGSLLFLSPEFDEENENSREKMLLWTSTDDGKTWKDTKVICRENGGYGDINTSPKKSPYMYVAQEHYEDNAFSVKFIKFNQMWLAN